MGVAINYLMRDEYLYFFTNFCRFGVEVGFAVSLFLPSKKRRKHFSLICMLFFLANTLVCALMALAESEKELNRYAALRTVTYLLLYVILIVWAFCAYKGGFWNMVFCLLFGIALRTFVYKVYLIITFVAVRCGSAAEIFGFGTLLHFLVYYPLLAALYAAIGVTLGRSIRGQNELTLTRQSAAVYLTVILLHSGINYVEKCLYGESDSGYFVALCMSAAFSLLIIFIQVLVFKEVRANAEKVVLTRLLDSDKKQYEQLRESMDTINVKCHDLRHQIRALRAGDAADEKYLDELSESISRYDCTVRTGNEALDVILTEKKAACEKADIRFTCIANGGILAFLEVPDLYSLFGNLLENAIEYVRSLDCAEKRFLSLRVCRERGMILVHAENYFEGTLEWRGGIPQSTKSDDGCHGYGIKSMKSIVKKYGGIFRCRVENHLFQTDIRFCDPE